jgi:hypothetical protein
VPRKTKPRCAVEGCAKPAAVEVLLYDVYHDGADQAYDVFCEQDFTCPYLCGTHWRENENGCKISEDFKEEDLARIRQTVPGGLSFVSVGDYYSNKHQAKGYSVYRPLEDA